MNSVIEIKAAVFDVLAQQDQLTVLNRQLEEKKAKLLGELNKAIEAEAKVDPEAK